MTTEKKTEGSTIVVGIDGSEHGNEALRWAAAEAELRSAKLVVAQAWSPTFGVMASPAGAIPADVWSSEDKRDATKNEMKKEVAAVLGDDPAVPVTIAAHQGNPADVLISTAENVGADLLVVGSRGRGGFKRLLLGSVGEQCATHAHCPVVIIRPIT
ncbi:MAG: universal stress protein [Actinobacteria bacterium]|nr:universal stress protein [Actinomycetota bacterium]